MSERFTHFSVSDIRFPTSLMRDGSDAMNPDPDYSVAYVVVHTSSGAEGHGFVFTIGRGTEVAVAAIRALEQLVVGLDVEQTLVDMGAFWRRLDFDSQLRWLGPDKGVMHMAIGAVTNAVWDLYAKSVDKPLWKALADMSPQQLVGLVDFRYLNDALTADEALELLEAAAPGRPEREHRLRGQGFPAYTTSAGWLGYSDEKVVRLVTEALADGFTHLKLKVGLDIEDDVRRVKLVRELVGPDVLLSVDANQRWGVLESIANIRQLQPFGLNWIEEPTSPDDVLGHARVRRAVSPVKVATGEHVANGVMFKQLIAGGGIDICQIDACRVGGVNENVAILLLAAKYGVPVCPHAGGVGLCENVQHLAMFDYVAVSGSTEGRWIEYVDHLHEHFVSPVHVSRGHYEAPTDPGASTQMLADSIAQYRFPDGPVWAQRQHLEVS